MEAALAHLNLLDGREPSHAAVLLFGRDPQRFLLTSEVKCLHFHGTEVRKPIPSYQIYKGTVFELVDQALDFVMSKIARRVGTRALGPVAPVDYELPREAVAEAIVNAVAHRHYTSNASVQVMLFTDRLEVWTRQQLQRVLGLKDDEHLRFRRPDGRLLPDVPLPPTISDDPVKALRMRNEAAGLHLHARTTCPGWLGEPLDVGWAIDVLHPRALQPVAIGE
jgi:hypothetical protein